MDEILRFKADKATMVACSIVNNYEKFTNLATANVGELAAEITQGIFATLEVDILEHPETSVTEQTKRKNTFPAPAITEDQYDGNETEDYDEPKGKRPEKKSFMGDDGVERFKSVCKKCHKVTWTKAKVYEYCFEHK